MLGRIGATISNLLRGPEHQGGIPDAQSAVRCRSKIKTKELQFDLLS